MVVEIRSNPMGPASPRKAPYIWATWLVDLLSGTRCQYRYWFQTHFKLNARATEFDDPSYQVRHGRMLTELERELRERGMTPEVEYTISLPIGQQGAQVSGSIDCLVDDDGSKIATVHECKTVERKQKHKIQTWLYMLLLTGRKRFRDKGIRGIVIYPESREELSGMPEDFASHVDFYEQLLVSDNPPRKRPGRDCRSCPITSLDCPERREGGAEYDDLDDEE